MDVGYLAYRGAWQTIQGIVEEEEQSGSIRDRIQFQIFRRRSCGGDAKHELSVFAHSARYNYSSQPLGCQGHEIVLSPMHSTMNRKSPGNGMRTLFLAVLPSPWLLVGPWQSGSTVDIIQRHQKIG